MIIKTSFGEGAMNYPTGEVAACVCNIIDCGLQENKYNPDRPQRKVMFVFELNCKKEDGEHMTITKTFTASMHKKGSLRPFIEQWRGRPYADDDVAEFDTEPLMGRFVMLNLQKQKNENNGKEYTEIFSIRNARQDETFNATLKDFIPERAQDMIDNQLKPNAPKAQPAPSTDQYGGDSKSFPDDIPF